MALDRKMIVQAALGLLDQQGIEGLTMRRLAEALGVQAPSIYWHYADKPALLDDIANALLEDVARTADKSADFRSVLRRSAGELRHALCARRDGAQVYAGTLVVGDNALRLAESMIGALLAAGFDAGTATRASFSLLYFVLGFVIEEQALGRQAGLDPASIGARLEQLGQNRFPALQQAAPHLVEPDQDARFAFGVDLFVRGLGAPPAAHDDKIDELVKAWRKLV